MYSVDDETRALTNALEDLRIAAGNLRLPEMEIRWAAPDGELDETVDPEIQQRRKYVDALFSDYEGARLGPVTWPLDQVAPPDKPDEWLIEGLIRPGTTVMFAGRYGAAKSWLSRQLALAAGAGMKLFLDRYPIRRPLNVLVVDEDNGPDEEWRREESLLAHLELERGDVGRVRRVSLEGVQLSEERWQRWLRGQIRTWEIDLVILDPISEMHGGKELREDPDFRSLLAFLKRLKVDFPRTATLLVHHTRKRGQTDPKERDLDDVRGQWGQTPDVIALVSPMAEQRAVFSVHKRVPHSRLMLAQVPRGETGEGGLRMVADEESTKTTAQVTDGRVLGAIQAGARTVEEIRIGTGLSKQGVYKVIKRLSAAGLVPPKAPFEILRDNDDPLAELES